MDDTTKKREAPLVAGGQGRSDESVARDSIGTATVLTFAALILIAVLACQA